MNSMVYSIKISFSLLLIFICLNEVRAQEIVINEKQHLLNDRRKNLIFANLEANSTLRIAINDSSSSRVQVGPFTSSKDDSIKVYCPIDGPKQIIYRYDKTNIDCLNFRIELNGQLEQIILEIFGGKETYLVIIENEY